MHLVGDADGLYVLFVYVPCLQPDLLGGLLQIVHPLGRILFGPTRLKGADRRFGFRPEGRSDTFATLSFYQRSLYRGTADIVTE